MTGRLYVGTSGFAYPDWSPRFYPEGLRADQLLPHYASRFQACELNNTFYARPTEAKIDSWLRSTPESFRFAVKAQRGGAMRALLRDPAGSVPWLTEPLPRFGERLGTVLFRVPGEVRIDLERLATFLGTWPRTIPITMEFQDTSWHVDEVFEALHGASAALCATDLPDDPEPPTVRATGNFLYLRLRRHEYANDELDAWAERVTPFLDDGRDVFVFFRHDETGRATELAQGLDESVRRLLPALPAGPAAV
jgi:uncharacterized protein YecE (DUF72 family)